MKLIVIIPAYNEEETINEIIKRIPKNVCEYTEIIVINDGSEDKTEENAKSAGAIVISHQKNLGLAKTFQTGISEALDRKSDVIVHIDADGQYLPEDIPKLVQPILNNEADIVLGSRFAGTIEQMPKVKRIGNRMFSWLLRKTTKTNITDFQTGFRAFTAHVAKRLVIRSKYTYTQEMIIDAVCKDFKIKEVPIHFAKRSSGKSRLIPNPFSYAFKAFKTLFRSMRDFRPMLIFGIIGALFLLSGTSIGIYLSYSYFKGDSISNPLLWISTLLIMLGVQSLLFGLLADMIVTVRKDISKIK